MPEMEGVEELFGSQGDYPFVRRLPISGYLLFAAFVPGIAYKNVDSSE